MIEKFIDLTYLQNPETLITEKLTKYKFDIDLSLSTGELIQDVSIMYTLSKPKEMPILEMLGVVLGESFFDINPFNNLCCFFEWDESIKSRNLVPTYKNVTQIIIKSVSKVV
jgi:hypothetical protein